MAATPNGDDPECGQSPLNPVSEVSDSLEDRFKRELAHAAANSAPAHAFDRAEQDWAPACLVMPALSRDAIQTILYRWGSFISSGEYHGTASRPASFDDDDLDVICMAAEKRGVESTPIRSFTESTISLGRPDKELAKQAIQAVQRLETILQLEIAERVAAPRRDSGQTEKPDAARAGDEGAGRLPDEIRQAAATSTGHEDTSSCRPHQPSSDGHNEDFSTVWWNGERYEFTRPQQRAIVKRLWEARERGFPLVTSKELRTVTGSEADEFSVPHIFRIKKNKPHPAWGKMIKTNKAGKYEIAETP